MLPVNINVIHHKKMLLNDFQLLTNASNQHF